MAYRFEKEPNGGEAIIIDGFENGIASDPYSGSNIMQQVDLETPGEVAVGYPITTSTISGATLGKPIARSTRLFPYGSPGVPSGSPQSFAILDNGGQVFEATSTTGTWTFLSTSNSGTGSTNLDGIAYWMGYLFKTRGANIDYWDGSTWHTGWQTTLSSGFKHYMYVATDNVLYITNGNFLASITVSGTITNFDPTTSGTYVFSIDKLELPVTDVALSIAEIGGGNTPQSTLLVGGILNAIYPWDKISPSFNLPIYVPDSYIGKMVSVNQNAFIFPGNQQGRGRIYITNGSQADLFFKIPDYITGEQDPYFIWGDAISHRNNLLFGFFIGHNSGSGLIQNINEVWAINLATHTTTTGIALPSKTFRSVSSLPSVDTFTASATCLISPLGLSGSGFNYIVAWDDNGSGAGIGRSSTTTGTGTGGFQTDLIPVGTFLQKKTFSQVEYKLRTALKSGESFSMTPFVDGAVKSNLVFNPTPATGQLSGVAPINFTGAQWLQFQVSMTGNNAGSGVRIKEIRIR